VDSNLYNAGGNVGIGTTPGGKGKLQVNNTMKFTNTSANSDDGVLGTAPYAAGLNIVGINTDGGGRKINEWGSIIQNENPVNNTFIGTSYFGDAYAGGQQVCRANTTITGCPTGAGGGVTGSGSIDRVTKWTSSGTNLGDSVIYQSGSNIGINTGPSITLAIGDNDTGLQWWGDGQLDLYTNSGGRVQVRDSQVTVTNDLYIGSQRVCRANGVGCPARTTAACSTPTMTNPACTATCPAGYSVTGGGMNFASSGVGPVYDMENNPSGANSWRCSVTTASGASALTCFAICMVP